MCLQRNPTVGREAEQFNIPLNCSLHVQRRNDGGGSAVDDYSAPRPYVTRLPGEDAGTTRSEPRSLLSPRR